MRLAKHFGGKSFSHRYFLSQSTSQYQCASNAHWVQVGDQIAANRTEGPCSSTRNDRLQYLKSGVAAIVAALPPLREHVPHHDAVRATTRRSPMGLAH
jgi:hypothetical protein